MAKKDSHDDRSESVAHEVLQAFNAEDVMDAPGERKEPPDPDADDDPIDAAAPAPPG